MSSAPASCDESVIDLFAALSRSLLQYLGEADPWTDPEHADAHATLRRLASNQRRSSSEAAELLSRRHLLPESTTYPSEFTRLHYVALDFAIDRLVANQLGVVATASAARLACARDSAARVVQRIHAREAEHLAELRRLRDTLRAPA